MCALIFLIILTPWEEYTSVRKLYDQGEFIEAKSEFEFLLQKYPQSDITPYCMFYIANLSRDPEEAIEYYNTITNLSPESKVADNAFARLASYYFVTAKYQIADSICRIILKEYSDGDCVDDSNDWIDRIRSFNDIQLFAIQIGAFKDLKNAEGCISEYNNFSTMIVFNGSFHKALLGRFYSREDANSFKEEMKVEGFVVKIPEGCD
ncbi:SPOR domain-containing protein [candidate division WOR-3 bacterium]|nr:SPOR domain-containing protein [candidate division WOR-3 bacterium]